MKKVEDFFKSFLSDIQLTSTQRADAQTKYQGVINCLLTTFIIVPDKTKTSSFLDLTKQRPTSVHLTMVLMLMFCLRLAAIATIATKTIPLDCFRKYAMP